MVLAGMSGSRRDQPMEFKESRKDVEAILACCMICDDTFGSRLYRATLLPCSINAPVKVYGQSRDRIRKGIAQIGV